MPSARRSTPSDAAPVRHPVPPHRGDGHVRDDRSGRGHAPPGRRSRSADTVRHRESVPSALLSTAQRLLPDGPLPIVLGGSALAVAGVIYWPFVAAIGVGCVPFRRWHRTA